MSKNTIIAAQLRKLAGDFRKLALEHDRVADGLQAAAKRALLGNFEPAQEWVAALREYKPAPPPVPSLPLEH